MPLSTRREAHAVEGAGAAHARAAEAREDRADFEACRAEVRARAAGAALGLFGPESVSWTV